MFTGIVEETGKVVGIIDKKSFKQITIGCTTVLNDLKEGDSISVNGVCLTAAAVKNDYFTADISPETIKKSNLGEMNIGTMLNLERAVTASARLGGHIVTGHVDGTGIIINKNMMDEGLFFNIRSDNSILKYVVNNGSVAVDGISLTVVETWSTHFSLMLIPHTLSHTSIIHKRKGSKVNIETDIIGKYIERFVNINMKSKDKDISVSLLKKHGFC